MTTTERAQLERILSDLQSLSLAMSRRERFAFGHGEWILLNCKTARERLRKIDKDFQDVCGFLINVAQNVLDSKTVF